MASARSEGDVPLPRGWTKHARSALIRAVSLAATALNLAYGKTTTSKSARNRLDRVTTEIALLKEELDIKDARWSRLPSRRRLRCASAARAQFGELLTAQVHATVILAIMPRRTEMSRIRNVRIISTGPAARRSSLCTNSTAGLLAGLRDSETTLSIIPT